MPHVFVAVDQPLMRDMLCAALRCEDDVEVIECSMEGVTGAEEAHALRPEVIVTCDGPHRPSREVVALFRDACPRSKIVMILFSERAVDLEKRGGADAVIDTSDGLDGLLRAIRAVAC